eukprot:2598037-Ditylum_brightwellii.AAC.2
MPSNSLWCLMLKKEQFTWTKTDSTEVYDRPSLIWAKINTINNVKLARYNNNPGKMLDKMEMKFNQIQDVLQKLVFTTKQFTIQVFCAILTSANQDFL